MKRMQGAAAPDDTGLSLSQVVHLSSANIMRPPLLWGQGLDEPFRSRDTGLGLNAVFDRSAFSHAIVGSGCRSRESSS